MNIRINVHVLLDEVKLELSVAYYYAYAIIIFLKKVFFHVLKIVEILFLVYFSIFLQDFYLNLTLKALYLVSTT